MSDETIFATLPEITAETKRRVELQFNHYIWYEGNGSRDRRAFHCSVCGASWTLDDLRTVTDDDRILHDADHGEEVTCPRCGARAKLMCLGRCRSGWRYSQAFGISIVAAAEGNPDEVWIRTFRISRNYGGYYNRGSGIRYNTQPEWKEVSRHRMVPGKAEYWSVGAYSDELTRADRIYDYYNNKNWQDVVDGDCADAIVFQTPLAATFLRYCAWSEYARKYSTSPALYLCAYAEHPQIEMMVKLGYSGVVQELVMERKKNVRTVNWEATRPHEAFRLSKADYAEWQRQGGDFRLRKIFATYRRHGARWAAAQEEYDATKKMHYLGEVWVKSCARAAGKDFHSVLVWLEGQKECVPVYSGSGAFYKWRDYIAMAREVGYDLTEPKVLLPEDVFRAHDEVMALKRQLAAEKEARRQQAHENAFLAQIPRYRRKYTASDGVYMIRVPESVREIVAEGQALDHCVGRMNYIRNMAEGKNAIVFLRRCAEPDKPWYTIEVSPKRIVQCEGARREDGKAGYYGHLYRDDLPDDAKAFLDAWEAKVCKAEKTTEKVKESA